MNTFRYDSTSIEYFDSQDLGSIGDAPTSTVDRGTNFFDLIVEDGTAGVVNNEFIVETGTDFIVDDVTATEDYNLIVWTETTYPYGNINVSGGEENSAGVVFVAAAEPIVLREKAIVITKQAWTGSGTLFEIANGLERKVAPYIGGSGPLRISGAVQDSATFDFTEESLKAYGSDTDNGQVTAAVGSSVDYGTVTSLATPDGEIDHGDITKNEGIPFGSLKLIGIQVTSNRFNSYRGSGSFSVLSGGVDQLEEPVGSQTYIVGRNLATGQFIRRDVIGLRFHGGNPEAFARVGYQGSGSLFGFSGGLERKVYDYNSGSIVTFSVGTDAGDVTSAATTTEDYGQVAAQSSGDTDHGSLVITETRQPLTGLFKLTGGDIAHSNPRAFAGSGAIKTYKGKAVVNAGQASDFAFLPHWRSRGGITITNHVIPDAFARAHVGSGSLFEIGQKDERAVFSYNVGPLTFTVPEILLAPWNGTSEYTGSNVSAVASGNGLGQSGGFNSSTTTYWRFTGQSSSNTAGTNPRILTLGPLDLTNYNQFEFTAIAGTSSNGGENCDADEDLYISYSTDGGTTYNQIVIYDAEDERFTGSTFGLVRRDIPEAAKTSNVILKFHQEQHSGSAFDQWGIEYVKVLENTVPGSGQVPDTIGSVDQGTVDQSAGTNENYGTITEPFTNGILDYGQLRPGFFKFGNINITGGDTAHTNPRAYRGAIEHVTENPIQTTTILPDDLVNVASYNTVFDDVNVRNAGTGTGSVNGFNIGRHLAFEGGSTVDNVRSLTFEIDTRQFDQMAITVIRGDGTNGGDAPEVNEHLRLFYSPDPSYPGGVGGFLQFGTILAHDSTDGTAAPVRKVFNLNNSFLNNENQRFSIRQGGADSGVDNYAITKIEFLNTASAASITPFDLQPTSFFLSGGRATVQFVEPAVQVYHYGLGENQTSAGEFLKLGGGMSDIKVVKGSWIGSGSLNNSGKNDERAVFDYTEESIAVVQDPIDNGLVTASATATADYGAVTQPSTGDTIYGSITNVITNNPFGKLFEWTGGDIAHSNPKAYTGSTAEVRITGGYSNLKFVSQAGESTALFDITNGPGREFNTYARVRPFIASGSLFSHGVKTEKATVAYNESSIAESFAFTDAGSVTTSASSSVDYGQINIAVPASNITDNGSLLIVTGDERPLGKLFEIQGSAIENFFPKFIWNRFSPAIRIFNEQQDPADFRFMPHWRGVPVGSPSLRNAPDGEFNTYARVRPFIASGSLFSHGVKTEKATVDYNSASIVEFAPGGDYGSITNSAGTTTDYGTVTSLATPDGEIDLGQIIITETRQPLTGLFDFSGVSETQFIRGPYVARNGFIRFYKGQSAATDFRFMPHWRAVPDGAHIISGSAETPRARDFVGKGRLFGIGDKVEKATFDYNGGSIVDLTPSEDYGSITNNVTTTDDLGSITSTTPGGEVDHGQIIITQTRQALTGLLQLQGTSENQFVRGPYVARPTGFRIFNEQQDPADFRFSPHWRSRPYEQGKLTGDAETPRARDFVGSGSLFHIGDKVEKAVFRYTTASVVPFTVGDDYGSITNNATTTDDFGSVASTTPGGEQDLGSVLITQTRQPLTGLFRITGGDKGHKQTFSEVSQTVQISISGAAIERVTSGDDENTILFNFTGSLTESFSKGNYAGSGSLFHIGDRVERATFSYNTSSVIEGYGIQQYGLITDTTSATQDYGSVTSASQPPHTDHGNMVTLPGEENPFGLFRIAGGDIGHKQTFTEFSSGSLFGASGAAEAAVWQTPEETFLFRTSGGAIEKHVENYVGTGNIKIKEETPLAPNSHIRFRPHWRTQHLLGTPRILGNADPAFKGAYVSEGVFSRMYTHDKGEEWLRYRPSPRYVNSIYGKIGGSAFVNGDGGTRKINVYGYYGDDRDPGTSGSLFGIGGGAEASSVTPPTNTVLFRVNGTSPSKWNPAWTSRFVGSPRLSGTPDLVLRFNIFTNPEVAKFTFNGDAVPVRTIIHKGSGKLFSAGSAAEVVGFNPETETRAFKFSGEPIVRIRVILFQFGTLFGFGGASESRTIEVPQSTVLFVPSGTADTDRTRAFEGAGSETLSGQSVERRTAAHAGSGSLFSAGGAAESRTASIPESTVLFSAAGGDQNAFARTIIGTGSAAISGDSADSRSKIHVGSGSLFAIGGASESATVTEESTGLFEFNGSAEPVIRTRGFAGSGSLFAIGGGVEIAAVAPESTGLFTVSGEAQAPFARTKIGAGTTFVSGDSENKATRVYTGEGQLSTFGGGAEVVGFNPAEETLLYEFNGTAEPVIRTRGFSASGSASVSGEAVPVITLSFVGSGNLTTFGGGAESRTIDVENTTLFETRGGATESFSKGTYNADGDTTISGEATDIKIVVSNNVFGYVGRTSGQAIEKQTDDYVGSGSLFALSSGTLARTRDYDETEIGQQGEVVSTNLFRISGNNPGSVTRITQPGTVRISMQGEAVPVLKLFSPIRIYSTII